MSARGLTRTKAADNNSASKAPGATTMPIAASAGMFDSAIKSERGHGGQVGEQQRGQHLAVGRRALLLQHVEEQRVVAADRDDQQQADEVQDAELHAGQRQAAHRQQHRQQQRLADREQAPPRAQRPGHQHDHAERAEQRLALRFFEVMAVQALQLGADVLHLHVAARGERLLHLVGVQRRAVGAAPGGFAAVAAATGWPRCRRRAARSARR